MDFVRPIVNAGVKAFDGILYTCAIGVNVVKNTPGAVSRAITAYNVYKSENYVGPLTAKAVIEVVNYVVVNKICLNGLIWSTDISFMNFLIDVDKYKVHIEICVKIISIIFDPEDITAMIGYLETYESNNISTSIAVKIDKLLEIAEQIVEMITTNSDDPVAIALPPCLSDKIKSTSCGNDIQKSISACSEKIRDENNKKNPINREALFKIINEYKPDPYLGEDENNQKRMKLILVIAFILNLYAKTSEQGLSTWNTVEGKEDEEDEEEYQSQFPGGNRVKSRRVKSRRVKSRRNKSRRNKSRRNKSRRNRK